MMKKFFKNLDQACDEEFMTFHHDFNHYFSASNSGNPAMLDKPINMKNKVKKSYFLNFVFLARALSNLSVGGQKFSAFLTENKLGDNMSFHAFHLIQLCRSCFDKSFERSGFLEVLMQYDRARSTKRQPSEHKSELSGSCSSSTNFE